MYTKLNKNCQIKRHLSALIPFESWQAFNKMRKSFTVILFMAMQIYNNNNNDNPDIIIAFIIM